MSQGLLSGPDHIPTPLCRRCQMPLAPSERSGSNLTGFEDLYLRAKARIWP